jgi:rod shape-determining protein MreC
LKKFFTAFIRFLKLGNGIVSLIFCLLVSFYLLNRDIQHKKFVVDSVLSTFFFPLQYTISSINHIKNIMEENKNLRNEFTRIKLERDLLIQAGIENNRLRDMIGFRRLAIWPLQAAQVVAYSPGNLKTNIVVNVGLADSIKVNMPVLAMGGLVGKVSDVYEGHSHVQLLLDPSVKVSVIENNSRTIGIMESNDSRKLYMSVFKNSEIRTGDTIVTSGFGGVFPKGLMVGKVKGFIDGNISVLQRAEIELFQKPNLVEEVFILLKEEDWIYRQ